MAVRTAGVVRLEVVPDLTGFQKSLRQQLTGKINAKAKVQAEADTDQAVSDIEKAARDTKAKSTVDTEVDSSKVKKDVEQAAKNAKSTTQIEGKFVDTGVKRSVDGLVNSMKPQVSVLGRFQDGGLRSGVTGAMSSISSQSRTAGQSMVTTLSGAARSAGAAITTPITSAASTVGNSMKSSMQNGVSAINGIPPAARLAVGALTAVAGPLAILKGGFDRLMGIQKSEIIFKNIGLTSAETEAQMAKLSDQVTGTSVSLAEAAQRSAAFAQANVELGEPMDNAVSAFTALSAAAGNSGVDVGMVMQQISAQGKLTGGDLMQLSNAGINASAWLADEMGISMAEVRDQVSDGSVDFETFVAAVNNGAGDLAKEMGQTLPAKISNMKTAFSNLGATILGPVIAPMTKGVEGITAATKASVAPLKEMFAWISNGSAGAEVTRKVLAGIGIAIASSFAPAMIGLVIKGLTGVGGALKTVIGIMNPWAAVIGLVIAGIVLLWTKCEWFRNAVTGIWDRIVEGFKPILAVFDTLKTAWDEITAVFTDGDGGSGALASLVGMDTAQAVVDTVARVGDAFRGVMDVVKQIPELARGVWDVLFKGDFTGMPFGIEEDSPIVNVLFGIRDAGQRVWDIVKKIGSAMAEAGRSVASSAWESIKSVFTAIVSVGRSLFDAFVQIGTAVWDLVKVLAPVLWPILKTIGMIIGGVVVAAIFTMIGAFKLIANIVRIAAAVFSWFAQNILSPLIGVISTVASFLIDRLSGAFQWVKDAVMNVGDAFASGFNWAKEVVGNFTEWVVNAFNWLKDGIGTVMGAIGSFFSTVWDGMKVAWDAVGQPILDFIIGAFNFLWEGIKLGGRLILATFEVIWTGLGLAWENWGRPVLDLVIQAFNFLWSGVQVVFGWIRAGWDLIWQGLQIAWTTVGQPVVNFVVAAFQNFWAGLQTVFGWVRAAWEGLWQAVQAVYNTVIAPVVAWVIAAFNRAKDLVIAAFNAIRNGIANAVNWIRTKISEMGQFMLGLYSSYVQPMVDRVIRGFQRIIDKVVGLKDKVVGALKGAGTWLVQTGKDLVQGLLNGVGDFGKKISSWFLDKIPGWIKTPFKKALGIKSPSRVFKGYGKNIGEGLVNGVDSMNKKVQASTQQMANKAAAVDMPDLSMTGSVDIAANPVVAAAAPLGEVITPKTTVAAPVGTSGAPGDPVGDSAALLDPKPLEEMATTFTTAATSVNTTATSVLDPMWLKQNLQLTNLGANFQTTAASVINPTWSLMATGLNAAKVAVMDPMFSAIRGQLTNTSTSFATASNTQITPTWRMMGSNLMAVKTGTVDPMFSGIRSGLNNTVQAFAQGASGIENQWNRVREATARPARFAINSVFNNGIVGMWNSASDLLGTKKMSAYHANFARGTSNVLPGYTPNRDPYTFVEPSTGMSIGLGGGEGIARPEVVRAIGPQQWDHMNAAARSGGVRGVHRSMGQFASGGIVGKTNLGQFAGGGVIPAMINIVKQKYPMLTMTSGQRAGGGLHGAGLATDWSNGSGNTPQQLSLARDIARTYPNSAELIYDSPGWSGNIKNGRRVGAFGSFYTMAQAGPHHHHVHWGMNTPPTMPFGGGVFAGGSNGGMDFDPKQMVADMNKPYQDKIKKALAGRRREGGLVDQWPEKIAAKMQSAATAKMTKAMEEMGGDPGGAGVARWRPLARKAMARVGFDWRNPAQLNAMMAQIASESGGDPGVIQKVQDVNSGGNEAQGLLQVIPGTFAAHRDPALPNDRTHPFANMVAALRYYRSAYGGDLTTMWGHGHGYDKGGIAPDKGFLEKFTNKPERVLSPTQTQSFERLVGLMSRDGVPGTERSSRTVEMVGQRVENQYVTRPGDVFRETRRGVRRVARQSGGTVRV